MGHIRIIQGDIANVPVDAVVQISGQAGDESFGDVVVSEAKGLEAKYILSSVGPVWQGGEKGEDKLLGLVFKNILDMAKTKGVKTIAFYAANIDKLKFPVKRAARIAMLEICDFIESNKNSGKVFFVCDEENNESFVSALNEIE